MKLLTENIPMYASLGSNQKTWYQDTYLEIKQMFPGDHDLVVDMLAATSIRASISSNVTQFYKAYRQFKSGKPFNGFLDATVNNLYNAVNGKELSGRKIKNFSKAIKGDPNSIVCDIWICRALDVDRKYIRKGYSKPLSGGPTDKIYDSVESFFRTEAINYNCEPRELQAMVWAGIRVYEWSKYVHARYTNFLIKNENQLSLWKK